MRGRSTAGNRIYHKDLARRSRRFGGPFGRLWALSSSKRLRAPSGVERQSNPAKPDSRKKAQEAQKSKGRAAKQELSGDLVSKNAWSGGLPGFLRLLRIFSAIAFARNSSRLSTFLQYSSAKYRRAKAARTAPSGARQSSAGRARFNCQFRLVRLSGKAQVPLQPGPHRQITGNLPEST